MNASLSVNPMCRRCGDPVDPDAEICPSCGAIASPTAVRTSAYSTMSGKTKGLIAAAFVLVVGLAAYTLMPGSMRSAPPDTTATDTARTLEVDRNRMREAPSDSRRDASVAAALDAVRESIQRHDIESAKVLLAAILALHRDNPEALALREEVKTSESQDKPVAPVARANTPVAKVVDSRRTATVMAATPHKPASKSRAHEHATRSSKTAPGVANAKARPQRAVTAKTNMARSPAAQKPRVLVREAQVKQVRAESLAPQSSDSHAVQTASGAPLISNGQQKASSDQNGSGGAAKPERWRDRGGMR